MSSDLSDQISACLMRQAGHGADAAQIAGSVVATCQDIEDALTAIIGTRGVAALLHRSVYVAGQTHAWLRETEAGLPETVDLRALTARLARQNAADAAAGGALLLYTLHSLLASLIGASLTERLLRTAWAPFLSSTPMDTST